MFEVRHMKAKSESMPQESLGFLLLQLRRAMRAELERKSRPYQTSAAQWTVLAALHWGEAATVSEIARFLLIDATGVTRLVDRLEDKGLVRRGAHETDRRVNVVRLTASGRKLMRKLERAALEVDEAFLGRLAPGEARQFLACVKTMLGDHASSAREYET
jgi:DNA-binding MarR family transcriptional regulator